MTDAPAPPQKGLLKVLGVAFGLAIIVGNTIGSGILRTPGDVAASVPSTGWFIAVWVAGGIYALCGALTLAELAVLIPKSGGEYQFARRAFGGYAGFVIGWTDWLSICAAGASIAIAFAELLGRQLPALAPAQTWIAVAVTALFVALHWLGVRSSDRLQQGLSLMKSVGFIAVAVVCFLPASAAGIPVAAPAAAPTLPVGAALVGALIISLQSVIYTYDGWNGAVYFSGEVKNPARELPSAMGWGVVAVLVVYLALNAASLHVLGIAGLAGEKFPMMASVRAVLGPSAESLVSLVMAASLLGALSAIVLIASRVPYAMGSDGLMPGAATRVNAGGTPTVALAASGIATIAFVATGTFETVIAIASLFFVMKYLVSFSAVFALRRRHPDLPRPYRALGFPAVTALLIVGSLGFIVGSYLTDTANAMMSTYILVASVPVYLIAKKLRRS
jgi:APA family basic amino acid/polyamine antiporter